MPAIYPLAIELLAREIAPDIRVALRTFLQRVGLKQGIIDKTSIENSSA
jgi:brefeldin A-inhibited guanine nucleotide-exchange protein